MQVSIARQQAIDKAKVPYLDSKALEARGSFKMRAVTVLCAFTLCGCVSHMPAAKNFNTPDEEIVTSPTHWGEIAKAAAEEIQSNFPKECQAATRIEDADSSGFSKGLSEFLASKLIDPPSDLGAAATPRVLSDAGDAACTIRVHADVIKHDRDVHGSYDATLLGTAAGGISWLFAAQPLSVPSWAAWLIGGAAGGTYDAARAGLPSPSSLEIIVVVEMSQRERTISSFVRAYYVNSADADEYLPHSQPSAPRTIAARLADAGAAPLAFEDCKECRPQQAPAPPVKKVKKPVPTPVPVNCPLTSLDQAKAVAPPVAGGCPVPPSKAAKAAPPANKLKAPKKSAIPRGHS